MKTMEISYFAPHATARMAAALYFMLALCIMPFMFIPIMCSSKGSNAPLFLIFMPFLYAGLSYIFTALGCVVYNALAKRMGGFELVIGVKKKKR